MTQLKAIIKEVRYGGASLYVVVSFETAKKPEDAFSKEYRISKAYSEEKIFGMIKKDLYLFRKHDRTAGKLKKFIGKEIP